MSILVRVLSMGHEFNLLVSLPGAWQDWRCWQCWPLPSQIRGPAGRPLGRPCWLSRPSCWRSAGVRRRYIAGEVRCYLINWNVTNGTPRHTNLVVNSTDCMNMGWSNAVEVETIAMVDARGTNGWRNICRRNNTASPAGFWGEGGEETKEKWTGAVMEDLKEARISRWGHEGRETQKKRTKVVMENLKEVKIPN